MDIDYIRILAGSSFVSLLLVALIVQSFPSETIANKLGEIMSYLLNIFLGPFSPL
jgi:hypothetical protein